MRAVFLFPDHMTKGMETVNLFPVSLLDSQAIILSSLKLSPTLEAHALRVFYLAFTVIYRLLDYSALLEDFSTGLSAYLSAIFYGDSGISIKKTTLSILSPLTSSSYLIFYTPAAIHSMSKS